MVSRKRRSFLLAVAVGFGVLVVSLGLLEISPALALERAGTDSVRLDAPAQAPPNDEDLIFIAYFTDDLSIDITDLSGNIIGEGEHGGAVRCNRNNCSQETQLQFTVPLTDPDLVYEYKFTTRQALDPVEERAVVSGRGTISSLGQKERFLFTATFQNNRDGTLSVRYEASRPDASFIIPEQPGTFRISSRR